MTNINGVDTKHPIKTKVDPWLQECLDAYDGMTAWRYVRASNYLPMAQMEPKDAYDGRVSRSRWASFYRQAIDGFAGILSDFTMGEDAIVQADTDEYQNVDGEGNSLKAILLEADKLALRDGWCAIFVEFPDRTEVSSRADEMQRGDTPYLQLVERCNVINWRVLNRKLILLVVERIVERYDGYGTQLVKQYWEYYPGGVNVWETVGSSNLDTQRIAQIPMRSPNGSPLTEIPVVFYPYSKLPRFDIAPPLHDLALDNFSHYQELSDYREVRYKCNLPVPVRKGFWQSGGSTPPPLILGANSALDIPIDGDFFFAEPTGVAIESTRQAIVDLEAQMLRRSLAFFGSTGGSDGSGQMTVDEVNLRSSQTRSQLMILASDKESATQSILRLWAMWLGETDGGSIAVNRSAMKSPLSPDAIRAFSEMVVQGLLSRESLLSLLSENGAMPEGFDLTEELKRADEEAQQKFDREVEMVGATTKALTENDKSDDSSTV